MYVRVFFSVYEIERSRSAAPIRIFFTAPMRIASIDVEEPTVYNITDFDRLKPETQQLIERHLRQT